MTSTYTSGNITLDRYAEILDRLVALAEAQWGESVNTDEDEILGHLLRNIALLQGEINEVIQAVYDATSVSNSTGTQLDNLLELIGLERQESAYSTVTLTLTATAATTVLTGSRFATSTTDLIFATDEELVFTAAGSDDVEATCTIVGANNAAIAAIDTIKTPIFGISAVTNAAAAIPGRARETAAELKERHTIAVATSGDQDISSIYEAVSEVTGVSAVYTLDNDTSVAIGSVPAKTIHIVVIGGTDADIAAAIANSKTASVQTYGSENISVYNSTTGQTRTINFDRGTAIPMTVKLVYTTETGVFPDNGEDLLREYISDMFDDFEMGDDVVYTKLYKPIYSVPGVTITTLTLDKVADNDPPVGTSDVAIATTELATIVDAKIYLA